MTVPTKAGVTEANIEIKQTTMSMQGFHAKSDFWGQTTLWMLIVMSFVPPIYFSFILGYHPGWGAIAGGLIGYAAFIGIMWFLEPITYYPVLGKSGTYIAFLTGNIANMCLPCSAAAQESIGAEPGTKKAEVAGTLGIAVASLTNIVIIIAVVLSGSYILTIIPQSVQNALQFILPAIYGGVLGQFALKKPLYGLVAFVIGMAVLFAPIFSLIKIVLCVAITIAVVLFIEKSKGGASD
ncbi:small-conductance mechanosensitive channel [Bacillus sp. CMF12]|uniref:small-conductance mechanosensitive channel n=1 Tax=Bacillaceae TaxID=186817 RepID=UPI001FB46B56|nr:MULTISPECIES: small-conductance mechanosensitive channel [Bacillaceae]MDF2037784.1 small-conductance mechanosensitive channel [Cytobacillus oceanisediminis]UOE55238.1 small-conductance mechanosensitive channel [Cytobacillus oceanisediminis]USK49694.1 small-conductance mechanosensitive channel [Bacillus sp. CMF12]